jgi:hypothetical protein
MKTTLLTLAICLGSIIGVAQNLVPFQDERGKWGFKETIGKVVILAIYDEVSYNCNNGESDFFDNGTMAVCQNYKWGFINNKGKVIIPIIYDRVFEFKEGIACVSKGGDLDTSRSYASYYNSKFGFIDMTGKTVIPFNFENINYGCDYDGGFNNGIAAVSQNNKWGFIDKTGKEIIPLIYDQVYSFSDGKAEVTLNGRIFYIDKNGNEIK